MAATTLRRWGLEAVAAGLAGVIFLACLGSLELWGKREQRLAAEALDTVETGRWLVATIQGRPRLEKPPLPRWTIAALATAAGRCDELLVRLPGAMAALGTVALTYMIGLRLGGRRLGLVAAIILSTTPLFIAEARQAGQDVPLAFFTTLAVYAALRTTDGGRRWEKASVAPLAAALAFHVALGLGFLCKGPVILAIVAAALLPWGIVSSKARSIARLALHPVGLPIGLALALGWPAAVWLGEPNAAGVWTAEIGQKTGALAIAHHGRVGFLLQWPAMVLPWVVAGAAGLALPFRRGGDRRAWVGWSWSVGTAAFLGCWAVAKPNYYVPCLPGFALLAGSAWIGLERRAATGERRARLLLEIQWGLWSILGAGALATSGRALGVSSPGWCAAMAAAAAGAGTVGAIASRRGRGATAMLPALAATAFVVVVGYGVVAPGANPARGHSGIARAIDRAVPPEVRTLHFFHELDEGLWFYLRDRRLVAVPGSQPRYNDAYDNIAAGAPPRRLALRAGAILADWLHEAPPGGSYLLLRDKVNDALAPELVAAVPLLRERDARRNGLVLLHLPASPRAAAADRERR